MEYHIVFILNHTLLLYLFILSNAFIILKFFALRTFSTFFTIIFFALITARVTLRCQNTNINILIQRHSSI